MHEGHLSHSPEISPLIHAPRGRAKPLHQSPFKFFPEGLRNPSRARNVAFPHLHTHLVGTERERKQPTSNKYLNAATSLLLYLLPKQ